MRGTKAVAGAILAIGLLVCRAAFADPAVSTDQGDNKWRNLVARFDSDLHSGDAEDALLSLRTIASRWPEHLGDIPEQNILIALRNTRGQAQLERAALSADEALYDANWTPIHADFSDQYYNLAIEYLATGETDKGVAAAKHIKQGRIVLRMAVDHRFDGVPRLDPIASLKAQVADATDRATREPKLLKPISDRIEYMIYLGDGASALAAADEAINAVVQSPRAFDDANEQLVWILNDKAWALDLLGLHDEAAKQMEQASVFPEHGRPNVSQSINLGDELYHLDRGRDALKAVASITRELTSPYGFMEAEEVRACGSAEVGDSGGVRSALNELRAGQSEDPDAAFEGALCAGDLDLASAILVHELDDPASRGAALVQVQTYLTPNNPTDWLQKRQSQIAALLQRPDVRSAVDRVGAIRSWPIPPPRT